MTRAAADRPPARDDELDAVERLYVEHGDFVWRAARSMGVAEDEREDVVQDVFVVVHRRLAAYEGRGAITSWLYGIVRGLCWNRRRRAERRRTHLRALAVERVAPPPPDPGAAEAFGRFLAGLDEARRAVFELCEVEGMSGPEVAHALGLNVNTVYTRLRAAKKAFVAFAEEESKR
jgi:RNA polymerase sigma-70 factor (ECF subfamily)